MPEKLFSPLEHPIHSELPGASAEIRAQVRLFHC